MQLHKHQILGYLFCIAVFMMVSCQDKEYNGDSIVNYPDMNVLLKENLDPYQQEPYSFQLNTIKDGKKDSVFMKANQVDWKAIREPFMKANVFNPTYDGKYKVDVITDTIYGRMTMMCTSLDIKLPTSKVTITARTADNKVTSIYAEMREVSMFKSTEYKLLYSVGKQIQIQELEKRSLSKASSTIKTLLFKLDEVAQ